MSSAPSTPAEATGKAYEVDTTDEMLETAQAAGRFAPNTAAEKPWRRSSGSGIIPV
ncbi:hypothetical protein ACH5A3_40245 [Streptomyces echinatus]|uniref:hypothetical protein n=1 Tax=Streptomyces echinatus TaxID=67293 RepID=UPI00378B9FA2